MYNTYTSQGIVIKPNVIAEGDKVTLMYNGLLAKSGADKVYAHYGYGDGTTWTNPSYIEMSKAGNTFDATIKIDRLSNLNIAFKDSANNWDNNSGTNYVFDVATR
jgi:hypothetical protein